MRGESSVNGWMCDAGESQQQLLAKFEGSHVGLRSGQFRLLPG
jgi:hypothetical protein